MPRLLILGATIAVLGTAPVRAAAQQDGDTAVALRARVVAVEGEDRVRIDVGEESGVQRGDRVRFFPARGDPIDGTVDLAEARTSRVLVLVASLPEPGTRAVVDLPPGRRAEAQDARDVPEGMPPHPGWRSLPDDWDSDLPLLAPPGSEARRRPREFHGRLYLGYDRTDDRGDTGRDDQVLRLGADLEFAHLLAEDDLLHVDVEYRWREVESGGAVLEDDAAFRLDRASYARGGTRDRPLRWQVGRFLQEGMPSFGVVDGAEIAHRTPGGWTYGGSAGWIPELFEGVAFEEDLQLAAFARWGTADGRWDAGAGVQKTWDDGERDRDLLVLEGGFRPRHGLHFSGTAWLDYYEDAEVPGGSEIELTRLFASVGWRGRDGSGTLLTASRVAFPLLQRNVGTIAPVDPLEDHEDRLRVSAWTPFGEHLRAHVAGWAWDDQDDDGGGGELRLDADRIAGQPLHLSGAVYADGGRFTRLLGLRTEARLDSSVGSWRVSWNGRDVEPVDDSGLGSTDGSVTSTRLGWDRFLRSGWSLSAWVQEDAGPFQDARSYGIYLQRIF